MSVPVRPILVAIFASWMCTATDATALEGRVLRESYRPSHVGETLEYEVYLPPGHDDGKGLRYLLMLPGYKDNQTYCRRKGFFSKAESLMREGSLSPLGLVCVGRGHGIWIDGPEDDRKYETALVVDLLGRLAIRHRFPDDPAQRGILGISLGGFAALKTGLRHPGLFHSVAALSPYLDPTYEAKVVAHEVPWPGSSAEDRRNAARPDFDVDRVLRDDPFWLTRHADRPIETPFFITCGRQDRHGLSEPSERLRSLLRSSGAQVRGDIMDGHHDARFWLRVFPAALRFFEDPAESP